MVDVIITEDADLLTFGAEEIFFKMDHNFYGEVYEYQNLKNCSEINIWYWD